MKARYAGGVTYLLVIVCLLLMRISSSLGVYAALGADPDAMFTCVVQILCFGALPLVGWFAFAHGMRIDKLPALADDFSLKKPSLRNLLLTLALAIPAVAVTSAVSTAWTRVLYVIGYDFPSSDPVAQTAAELFSELALVAVLPALFEEFTHRGLLLAAYGDRGERAALVSALLFGFEPSEDDFALFRVEPSGVSVGYRAVACGVKEVEAMSALEKKITEMDGENQVGEFVVSTLQTVVGVDFEAKEVQVAVITRENTKFRLMDEGQVDEILKAVAEKD